jgi:hypothetical protein
VPLPEPVPGLVISYAYLWHGEQELGREEGVKDRPCVVILAVKHEDGQRIVTVAPITHTPPRNAIDAIELPIATKHRLGLDDHKSWMVAAELNRFLWPGPDLRPIPNRPGVFAYGLLPRQLTRNLLQQVATLHRTQRLKMVHRDQDERESGH